MKSVFIVCSILALISIASAFPNKPMPLEYTTSLAAKKVGDEKDLMDFALGLLMAMDTFDKVPDSLQCAMDHSKEFSTIFKGILADVKGFKMSAAMSGLKDFFAIFHSGSCKSFTTEADAYFGNIITQLTNPVDIFKGDMRIAAKRSIVKADWDTFFSSYKAKNFYQAGLSMGEPLAIYLGFQ